MKINSLLLLFALQLVVTELFAQESFIPLYSNGVPNSKQAPANYVEKTENGQVHMVTTPGLIPFFPPQGKANGTSVIICPGGGYGWLAINGEGNDVGRMFAELGITAFVLKYRLPSDMIMVDKAIGPLQDAQRAIQIVRERATEWKLDPFKVGMIGFSAGGHLVSTAGTHFTHVVIDNPNNISVRPDFMLLVFSVISFGEYAHPGSKTKLIGKDAIPEQIAYFSNELQVTAQTPVTFIVHAENDATVPVENALLFYGALSKFKVKAELHIYQAGGHGFDMNNPTTPDSWFERCQNFLKQNKFYK
jgi:acetyl esterase/lipase